MNDMVADGSPAPVPSSVFVPREEQSAVLAAALATVRQTEGERRWSVALGRLSGWLVAATMVVPLGYTLSILKNRPVPQEKIWVAIMHSDGSTEAAKPIEDLTPSEREAAICQFMYDYVFYRVSYTWENIQRNYDRTRFVTYGDAQKEYVATMNEAPDRPTATLGKTGEKRVSDVTVSRTGPFAFEATYTLSIKNKEGVWLNDMKRRVLMSYGTFEGIPAEVARRLDPLKLVTTRWDDHPAVFDPTKTGGKQ
jgi:type IV secretory pathway component VirB8